MKYNLVVKEQAKADIENISIYYNKLRDNLGFEFWDAADIALQDITANPLGYQIKYSTFRAKLTKPFPYLLIYELTGKNVVVYQCFGGVDDPAKKYNHKK